MAPNSLGLGIASAPVTWLWGPVASLNLIDLLSPPLSALAMFWLLRRWVSWDGAAFVGGLFFGFSPFVLVSLALAHPNFGMLAPVPLIVGCLDDLFVRHRHPPLRVGAALGLLVAVEFFVSVEVLTLLVLFAVLAAVGRGACGPVLTGRRDHAGRGRRAPLPALGRGRPGWRRSCWPIPCGSSSPARPTCPVGPGPTPRPARSPTPPATSSTGSSAPR